MIPDAEISILHRGTGLSRSTKTDGDGNYALPALPIGVYDVTASRAGFGTLHSNDAAQAVHRVVDVFPAGQQQQIRTQLSFVLAGVLSQNLIARTDGPGRVLALEIMVPFRKRVLAIFDSLITSELHQPRRQ